MTRHLLSSMCAVVLVGLLGACGGDQPQKDQQALAGAGAVQAMGATVHRGSGAYSLYWFWAAPEVDGRTLIAAVSGDPAFGEKWWCETFDITLPLDSYPGLDLTGWLWLDYRVTQNAAGAENWRLEGTQHTRLYRAVVPTDATLEELYAFVCALPISAEAELLAWGTSEWKGTYVNVDLPFEGGPSVGPGNSLNNDSVVGKDLTAPTWCPSGVAELKVVLRETWADVHIGCVGK